MTVRAPASLHRHSRFFSVFLLVAIAVGCGGGEELPASLSVGQPAPSFELPSLDGETVRLKDLETEVLVVNFWATWCQPCLRELPALREIDRRDDVEVVGISLDTLDPETVAAFARRHELDYRILLGDQATFQRFRGFSIPYTLMLDRERRILAQFRGPAELEDLERELAGRGADTAG